MACAGCRPCVPVAAISSGGVPGSGPWWRALLGFLIWNWTRARLFMGDGGAATFLGAGVRRGGAAGSRARCRMAWPLLLVAVPLLADALICVTAGGLMAGPAGEFPAHRLAPLPAPGQQAAGRTVRVAWSTWWPRLIGAALLGVAAVPGRLRRPVGCCAWVWRSIARWLVPFSTAGFSSASRDGRMAGDGGRLLA